jgi:hypothetical protein
MAAIQVRPNFAIDTNILIDLGQHKSFARAFLAAFRTRGLAAPPTVIQELVGLCEDDKSGVQEAAMEALTHMREWGIFVYDLIAVGHGITEADTRKLIDAGLLPEEEFNDGLILIETALGGIPSLVTSDPHLLKIDASRLGEFLTSLDLLPVSIFHPKALLRNAPGVVL